MRACLHTHPLSLSLAHNTHPHSPHIPNTHHHHSPPPHHSPTRQVRQQRTVVGVGERGHAVLVDRDTAVAQGDTWGVKGSEGGSRGDDITASCRANLCVAARTVLAVEPKRASGTSAARASERSGTTSRHCGYAGDGVSRPCNHKIMAASLPTHEHNTQLQLVYIDSSSELTLIAVQPSHPQPHLRPYLKQQAMYQGMTHFVVCSQTAYRRWLVVTDELFETDISEVWWWRRHWRW